MRRTAFALALCSLTLIACGASERRTTNRVTMMMDNWVSGGTSSGGDIQEAICLWYDGSRKLPLDHLKHARGLFDDWRRQEGLYRKIESWNITEMTKVASAGTPAIVVSLDIDGKPYRMRVALGESIAWVN